MSSPNEIRPNMMGRSSFNPYRTAHMVPENDPWSRSEHGVPLQNIEHTNVNKYRGDDNVSSDKNGRVEVNLRELTDALAATVQNLTPTRTMENAQNEHSGVNQQKHGVTVTERPVWPSRSRDSMIGSQTIAASPTLGHETPMRSQQTKRNSYWAPAEVPDKEDSEPLLMNARIASTQSKHMYLVALAKGLLHYGAPTHRIESYMIKAAACLGVPTKFLYIPDGFTISLDHDSSYKSEYQLVQGGGNDLGKFDDLHKTSKLLNHDLISVDEALFRLEVLEHQKPRYSTWFLVLIYGFAAVGIGPFAYKARPIDLPITFTMGMVLGLFNLKLVPGNPLFHRIFEISAAILMSFLGRWLGSIRNSSGNHIFCYSAITQSCINLILPGYWITNAGLELMNHQITAGGVRMVHAFIYFLFLAYGITMGSSLYGFINADAVSDSVCSNTLNRNWNLFFVPFFSVQVSILSGAKLSQVPVMVFISFMGYAANFICITIFKGSFTFATSIGGFVIGIFGNLYAVSGAPIEGFLDRIFSRFQSNDNTFTQSADAAERSQAGMQTVPGPRYALAAAAMVPAMIVQVPSGLAAYGALLNGISGADAIVKSNGTTTSRGAGFGEVHLEGFPILVEVIQIGISIGFGLGLASLIMYSAMGKKKRSGIMSW